MATINQGTKLTLAALAVSNLVACSNGGTGAASSSSRLQIQNTPLAITSDGNSSMAVTLNGNLTLVANLAPPTVNGVTLQANAGNLYGLNLYVGYNIAGAASGGGVDVVSVAAPLVPILSAGQQFPTLDVNNVFFSGSSIYIAGNSSVQDSPARLQQYSSTLLGASNSLTNDIALPGYATVAVKGDLLATKLYVLTGDNSGLHVLNSSTFAETSYTAIPDARDVSVGLAGNVYVVSGGATAKIQKFDSAGTPGASLSIGNTGAAQSKATITAGATYGIASAGAQGIQVFCLADMTSVGSAPAPTGGVTNGVAFAGGLVFTADGDQGVSVYAMNQGNIVAGSSCNAATFTKLGQIAFGTSVSANHISFNAGFLFVSGGLGGVKIVSVPPVLLATGLITTL